jgi:aspartate carbamoyltransferase catalytic subunit
MALKTISWDDFSTMSPVEKGELILERDLFHVLIAQQFRRDFMDKLGELATQIRFIAKTQEGTRMLLDLLMDKRAMLFFTQPSTRTFLSFSAACQILGMRIGEVRNPSTSSEFKGESKDDSIRAFSSYFDMIIMRTEIGGLAERMAWVLSHSERPVPIINAGSGKDQHPTQALLDIYTLQRSFEERGGIDGKTVMFVGDLARGRTVRSLSMLLAQYEGVKQIFVAPDELQIRDDILEILGGKNVEFRKTSDFEGSIPSADAIYMTRIQDEWDKDKGESSKVDISKFSFLEKHLSLLGEHSVLMHPLPRRTEIAAEVDHDARAVYWRQMRNGMWIRAALIAAIFGVAERINSYHGEHLE